MDEGHRFLRAGLDRGFIDMRDARGRPGLPAWTQFRLLRRAGWEPVHGGLWVPSRDQTPPAVACRLAIEHLGPSACVTGASALHLLGVIRQPPDAVEVLRPAGKGLRPRAGLCIHYTHDFPSIRQLTVQQVRVSRAARSLAELARHTGFTPLVRTIADTIQARHCTMAQLEEELARGRFPGCGVLRRAVQALTEEHSHSSYERMGRRLLREAGITVVGRPMPVLAGTVPVAEVDLPFFELSYGVEIDGPHHLLAAQAARDRARDRMLLRDHGITIDRYLWFELDDEPERFVREVSAQLRKLAAFNSS